jgi:hypothetical protein
MDCQTAQQTLMTIADNEYMTKQNIISRFFAGDEQQRMGSYGDNQ